MRRTLSSWATRARRGLASMLDLGEANWRAAQAKTKETPPPSARGGGRAGPPSAAPLMREYTPPPKVAAALRWYWRWPTHTFVAFDRPALADAPLVSARELADVTSHLDGLAAAHRVRLGSLTWDVLVPTATLLLYVGALLAWVPLPRGALPPAADGGGGGSGGGWVHHHHAGDDDSGVAAARQAAAATALRLLAILVFAVSSHGMVASLLLCLWGEDLSAANEAGLRAMNDWLDDAVNPRYTGRRVRWVVKELTAAGEFVAARPPTLPPPHDGDGGSGAADGPLPTPHVTLLVSSAGGEPTPFSCGGGGRLQPHPHSRDDDGDVVPLSSRTAWGLLGRLAGGGSSGGSRTDDAPWRTRGSAWWSWRGGWWCWRRRAHGSPVAQCAGLEAEAVAADGDRAAPAAGCCSGRVGKGGASSYHLWAFSYGRPTSSSPVFIHHSRPVDDHALAHSGGDAHCVDADGALADDVRLGLDLDHSTDDGDDDGDDGSDDGDLGTVRHAGSLQLLLRGGSSGGLLFPAAASTAASSYTSPTASLRPLRLQPQPPPAVSVSPSRLMAVAAGFRTGRGAASAGGPAAPGVSGSGGGSLTPLTAAHRWADETARSLPGAAHTARHAPPNDSVVAAVAGAVGRAGSALLDTARRTVGSFSESFVAGGGGGGGETQAPSSASFDFLSSWPTALADGDGGGGGSGGGGAGALLLGPGDDSFTDGDLSRGMLAAGARGDGGGFASPITSPVQRARRAGTTVALALT